MSKRVDTEIDLSDGYGNTLELSLTATLTADELATVIDELDEDRRREVIYAIVGNPERVIDLLNDMGQDDRLQVLGEFCCHCGDHMGDRTCVCMRDD